MKFEFSAGGIVFRRAQDFGLKPQFSKKKIEILVAQHSKHHGWVFPKGLIGDKEEFKGEKKDLTAVREVKEETGIDAEIAEELPEVTYWYKFKGQTIKKTVYYFIMTFKGGDFTKRDDEMEKVEWILLDKVLEKLTYKSDKKVWEKAKEKIQRLVSSS